MSERVVAIIHHVLTNRNEWIERSHMKVVIQPDKHCVIVMAVRLLSNRGYQRLSFEMR